MAFQFATVTEKQFLAVNEAVVPENTKKATEFGFAICMYGFIIFSNEVIT